MHLPVTLLHQRLVCLCRVRSSIRHRHTIIGDAVLSSAHPPQRCAGERELATGPSSQADAAEAGSSSEEDTATFRDLSHIDPEFESDFAALLTESRGKAGTGGSAAQQAARESRPEDPDMPREQAGLDRMAFSVLLKRSGRDDRTRTIEVQSVILVLAI